MNFVSRAAGCEWIQAPKDATECDVFQMLILPMTQSSRPENICNIHDALGG